jgi:hypothetical protein
LIGATPPGTGLSLAVDKTKETDTIFHAGKCLELGLTLAAAGDIDGEGGAAAGS